jgi:hypothetical protein
MLPRGLLELVTYLRELGMISTAPRFVPDDRVAWLLDEFTAFLIGERGWARSTGCTLPRRYASIPAAVDAQR